MIAIEMEMPKSCHDCNFCHGFTSWHCILRDKMIDTNCIDPYSQRPDWCELLYMPPTVTRRKSNEELDAERKSFEYQLQSKYNDGYNKGVAHERHRIRERLGL